MLSGIKRKIVIGTAAVVLGGGAVAIGTMAPASGASTPSSVTITFVHGKFKGTVSSSNPACVYGRTVRIMRHAHKQTNVAGSDVTNHAGQYSVSKAGAHGFYSAVVLRTRLPGYAAGACKRASSGPITVP